jgi:drug/metabolite transporter (DMT)-like permease
VSTGVILLVLASALMHAAWNAILKRTRDPELASVPMMMISVATALGIALFVHPPFPPMRGAVWAIAAGILEAGYFRTLARALTRAPLGPVYTTVRGGALVVAWPISIAFLGERFTTPTAIGTGLVVVGLAATGAAQRPARGTEGPSLARGLGWAAICALFVGGYHVAYKLSLSAGGAPEIINAMSLGTAMIINLAVLGRARTSQALTTAREQPLAVVAAGVLAAVSFLVFLGAMKHAGAGFVLTLRNTSILFAQGFAALQGDRPKGLGIVGALLVTAGAIALAL